MKHCKKCGRDLPLSHFYKNKASKDRRAFYCKDCMKTAVITSVQKHESKTEEVGDHRPHGMLYEYCKHCGLPVYISMESHVRWTHMGIRP